MSTRSFFLGAGIVASLGALALPVRGATMLAPGRAAPVQSFSDKPIAGREYLVLSAAEFAPADPSAQPSHMALTPVAGAVSESAFVPIQLPHRAHLREVTCFLLRDDDDGRDATFRLQQIDIQSTKPVQTLATVSETVADDLERLSMSGLDVSIDTFRQGYFLAYEGPSKARLRGCRVGFDRG